MNKWADWNALKSFVKNDEITTEIERSMSQLDSCCQHFQVGYNKPSLQLTRHLSVHTDCYSASAV
jgi:hypothetical protein